MLPAVGGLSMAIPLGAVMGLPAPASALSSIAGNILPVPFVILFVCKIFSWMRKKSERLEKFADKYEKRAKEKGSRFGHSMFVGLLFFVAAPIPLPGMGAWTGALIAGIFGVKLKVAVPAIGIGVVIAGLLATGVTYGFLSLLVN